jgi:hypothetical protein
MHVIIVNNVKRIHHPETNFKIDGGKPDEIFIYKKIIAG